MYKVLVAINDSLLKKECTEILENFHSIKLIEFEANGQLQSDGLLDSLFLITNFLNDQNLEIFKQLRKRMPKFPIIFYNHSLMLSDIFWDLPKKDLFLIVGDERKWHLQQLVQRLLNAHWRRIPYEKLGIKYETLSARMKEVLQYIETNDLQKCDIFHLAEHLNITPSYFSQLFKNETGQSFRTFMQKVLNYYENLLFFDWGLGIKNVSKILGYSELSSYSRSFKRRKGQSPRAFVKFKDRAH